MVYFVFTCTVTCTVVDVKQYRHVFVSITVVSQVFLLCLLSSLSTVCGALVFVCVSLVHSLYIYQS
jgi:hypothetical protein